MVRQVSRDFGTTAATRLELEARALPYASVRISIEILPWGDESVVIIDEH